MMTGIGGADINGLSGGPLFKAQMAIDAKTKTPVPENAGNDDIRETAAKLETMFVSMLISEMKKAMPSGGFMPSGGAGGQVYETMLDHELADSISGPGLGFTDSLVRMLEGGAAFHNGPGKAGEPPAGTEKYGYGQHNDNVSEK